MRKADPPPVKPLLYVFRVLLTGIHLLCSGEVEASLPRLNDIFRLAYLPELIERKLSGPERGVLPDADLRFYEREYNRLREELAVAAHNSRLPEAPAGNTTCSSGCGLATGWRGCPSPAFELRRTSC